MNQQDNKYLDARITNLLILALFIYAIFVCYSCLHLLGDAIDFGVESMAKNEVVWRVSE